MIQKGDKLKCIFNTVLPGNTIAPDLKLGSEYIAQAICLDSAGNQHIDVGVESDVNSVTSYATKERLPEGPHWCHPNRFVKL